MKGYLVGNLNEQLSVYETDPQIAPVLRNILGSLVVPG